MQQGDARLVCVLSPCLRSSYIYIYLVSAYLEHYFGSGRHRVEQRRADDRSLLQPRSHSERVRDFNGQIAVILLDRVSHPCDIQALVSSPVPF